MATPIIATPILHHQKNILMVQFEYSKELIKRFSKLPGARWSKTLKSWYLPDTVAYRDQFGVSQKSAVGKAVIQQVDAINKPALKKNGAAINIKKL